MVEVNYSDFCGHIGSRAASAGTQTKIGTEEEPSVALPR